MHDVTGSKRYAQPIAVAAVFSAVLLWLLFTGLTEDYALMMGAGLLAVGAIPLIRAAVLKKDPFEIINLFTAWFMVSIGIKGVMDLNYGSAWLASYDAASEEFKANMFKVFAYSTIALIALYAGYWSKLGDLVGKKLPHVRFIPSQAHIRTVTVFIFVVAALGVLLFYNAIGGRQAVMDSARMVEEGIANGGKMVYNLLLDFAFIGFLVLYTVCLRRSKRIAERLMLMLFAALIALIFVIAPFKGLLVGLALYTLVINHYLKRRLTLKWILLIAVALVLLIPLLNNYRRFGFESLELVLQEYPLIFSEPAILSDLTIGRSAGADMFFLIIDRTPELGPFMYGSTLLKIFSSFVPRALWPEKPWSFGVDFSNTYLDTPMIASISPSTIGELYVNFHIPGIVLGFFIIGVFLRTLYSYCMSEGNPSMEGAVLYAVAVEKLIVLVDGPIVDYMVFMLIKAFPIATIGLLTALLSGIARRKHAALVALRRDEI